MRPAEAKEGVCKGDLLAMGGPYAAKKGEWLTFPVAASEPSRQQLGLPAHHRIVINAEIYKSFKINKMDYFIN